MKTWKRVAKVAGVVAAGALLLPHSVCAQAGETAPKTEARKKTSFFGVDVGASKTDAPQRETVITADKVDFDNKEGLILFDQNVLIDDAQFAMRSDRLIVFLESTNDVSQILAIGNVSVTNELRHATCDKAVYTKKDAQIVMTAEDGGVVRLVTNGDTAGEVTGHGVVFWLDDERVEVFSKKGGTEKATVVVPSLGTMKLKDGGEKKPLP